MTKEPKKYRQDMDIAHEIRYLRNELKRIRDIQSRKENEDRSLIIDFGINLSKSFEDLAKELKLLRQTYVLIRLSHMNKTQRKAFLKMADFIQAEDDFIEAFGGAEGNIIDTKKLARAI